MDTLLKWIMAVVGSLLSLFAPVTPLVLCALIFVMIDFVMGILAGRKRAARQHKDWYFSSDKAWKTVIKLTCIVVGIGMCHLIDTQILDFMNLHLAKLFTGMVCGRYSRVQDAFIAASTTNDAGSPPFHSINACDSVRYLLKSRKW